MAARETGEGPRLSLGRPFRRSDSTAQREHAGEPRADSNEAAVRATDNDALLSRASAVAAGYLPPDPYVRCFAEACDMSVRRPLLINIGTTLRSAEVDRRVDAFLHTGTLCASGPSAASDAAPRPSPAPGARVQIVSLGAGSDTRFWRLSDGSAHDAPPRALAKYVEVDYSDVTQQKLRQIRAHRTLSARLGELRDGASDADARSERYAILGVNLLDLLPDAAGKPSHAWETLVAQLDRSLPTLILCECVLAYLDASAADRLLRQFAACFPRLSLLCYDMCVAGDRQDAVGAPSRFGNVMLQNLSLELPGARKYTTPHAYAARFDRVMRETAGRSGAQRGGEGDAVGDAPPAMSRGEAEIASGAQSLRGLWHALDTDERRRLSRLEGLDEVEELEMLLGHYCLSWAERGGGAEGGAASTAEDSDSGGDQ
ncbi:[phosphatase 2A protein]-leucine-carboxy methyltransferase [Malassezia sp. CBS 17886]|nr:[phosphatase 2A protein]-leucine-carboxy methyltransferase [Malassezia sp. CBS 17886]